MPRGTYQNFHCQCPCPCDEPQPPPTSAFRRPYNISRCLWFSLLWGHCSFPLGPDAHTTLCAPSKSGVSVSPSPVEVLQSNPASLQSLILWEFLLPLLDPQIGNPDVELRTFTPVGGLLWYNCSPVCESSTQQLWNLILL